MKYKFKLHDHVQVLQPEDVSHHYHNYTGTVIGLSYGQKYHYKEKSRKTGYIRALYHKDYGCREYITIEEYNKNPQLYPHHNRVEYNDYRVRVNDGPKYPMYIVEFDKTHDLNWLPLKEEDLKLKG